ncbi:MAG: ABC transporter permease [Candidatus Hermodarchaeota archaeon]
MIKKVSKKKNSTIALLKNEISKNIKIIFRGPSRTLLLISLIFPITYLFFMNMIFGAVNFNYPIALVIPDYNSDDELNYALENNEIPNVEEFMDYLNNNDLVGPTIVKSHIQMIGISAQQFESTLELEEIVMIAILPENFENIIQSVKNGTWTEGNVTIELRCLNIHEDYLKNLYFGFQRKLKAYYDNVLFNETEVIYVYSDAHPERQTFPRMWTIGTEAIVFVCLVSSMIIGAAFIFIEKGNRMTPELALATAPNQNYTYLGKVLSASILSFIINFTLGTTIIFLWIGIQFPVNFLGFLLISFGSIILGSILGTFLGALIPEQVYAFPISLFTVLATLFLCGGFVSVEMFGPLLRSIANWIPFTYLYTIMGNTVLTGDAASVIQILGLIGYIILFFGLGLIIYRRFVIKPKN